MKDDACLFATPRSIRPTPQKTPPRASAAEPVSAHEPCRTEGPPPGEVMAGGHNDKAAERADDSAEAPTATSYVPGEPLLLTEREAAKALAVSPRTLWGLRNAGEIPCLRFGRAVRYDPADLQAWINRSKDSA